MKIKLENEAIKEYDRAISVLELAGDINQGLVRKACAARVDGKLVDLTTVLAADCEVHIITDSSEEGRKIIRHTAAHILAQAVKRIYPGVKLTIGPATERGFYYDFDSNKQFTKEDLPTIEKEMAKIIGEKLDINKIQLSREEAIKLLKSRNEGYKLEILSEIPEDETITFYQQGEFIDLCTGPHLSNTGNIGAFKLMDVGGVYWRGDSSNKMLSRIYGIAYESNKELKKYLKFIEEASRRDHRKLGKELELFSIVEEGPGFPFLLPKGVELKNSLIELWREVHREADYQEIQTPMILHKSLWEKSGHWEYYKENMYTTHIDEEEFAIKSMNCPGGMLVYQSKKRSYKDLPLRMGELGIVHRHELSGTLHGLMRVRNFTQDDAHIFMLESQVKQEIKGVIELIDKVYKMFGFKYHIELSTKPEKSIGDEATWELATKVLEESVAELGYSYILNEGDGAFYGPKLDFHLEDCLGRTWQCGTIQVDFQLPERFNLEYIGADGQAHQPITIHRVVFGSVERFIGILIEHFEGKFPTWLSPVQVKVLTISDKQNEYANSVVNKLKNKGVRVETDYRSEKIGNKIRVARNERVPYLVIIGQNEEEQGMISVRSRVRGDLGTKDLVVFIDEISAEIKGRA